MIAGNKPLPVRDFGGLNTVDDPADVGWGGALIATDVDVSTPGVVRSRDGAASWSGLLQPLTGMVALPHALFFSEQGSPGTLHAAVDASTWTTTASDAVTAVAAFGNTIFVAQNASASLITFTSGTWATPTCATVDDDAITTSGQSLPSATFVTVSPVDDRLVAASCSPLGGPGGSESSLHRVHFSDPGDPLTWTLNNYVDLSPGDGEVICSIVVWREYLMVFKRTKFFVFYGTSVDASGQPVFNYRTVHTGVGANPPDDSALARSVTAARDGVYFIGSDGVYRTTGGEPVLMSRAIDAVFSDRGGDYFDGTPPAMITCDERFVYCGGSQYTYVLDVASGKWVAWTLGSFPAVSDLDSDGNTELYFAKDVSGQDQIYRIAGARSCDVTTIYRAGWFAPAGPGVEATIRETEIVGRGDFVFSWARDFDITEAPGSTTALSLGTADVRAYSRKATCGELLAWEITGDANTDWQVSTVTPMLRDARGLGEETA